MQILFINFFLCIVSLASVQNKESMECKASKLGKYLISKPFDKTFQNCNIIIFQPGHCPMVYKVLCKLKSNSTWKKGFSFALAFNARITWIKMYARWKLIDL